MKTYEFRIDVIRHKGVTLIQWLKEVGTRGWSVVNVEVLERTLYTQRTVWLQREAHSPAPRNPIVINAGNGQATVKKNL